MQNPQQLLHQLLNDPNASNLLQVDGKYHDLSILNNPRPKQRPTKTLTRSRRRRKRKTYLPSKKLYPKTHKIPELKPTTVEGIFHREESKQTTTTMAATTQQQKHQQRKSRRTRGEEEEDDCAVVTEKDTSVSTHDTKLGAVRGPGAEEEDSAGSWEDDTTHGDSSSGIPSTAPSVARLPRRRAQEEEAEDGRSKAPPSRTPETTRKIADLSAADAHTPPTSSSSYYSTQSDSSFPAPPCTPVAPQRKLRSGGVPDTSTPPLVPHAPIRPVDVKREPIVSRKGKNPSTQKKEKRRTSKSKSSSRIRSDERDLVSSSRKGSSRAVKGTPDSSELAASWTSGMDYPAEPNKESSGKRRSKSSGRRSSHTRTETREPASSSTSSDQRRTLKSTKHFSWRGCAEASSTSTRRPKPSRKDSSSSRNKKKNEKEKLSGDKKEARSRPPSANKKSLPCPSSPPCSPATTSTATMTTTTTTPPRPSQPPRLSQRTSASTTNPPKHPERAKATTTTPPRQSQRVPPTTTTPPRQSQRRQQSPPKTTKPPREIPPPRQQQHFERTMVEVVPGQRVPLVGSEETWTLIQTPSGSRAVDCCFCTSSLQCANVVTMVLCPCCRMISPLDMDDPSVDQTPLLGLGVNSREMRSRSVARAMSIQSSSSTSTTPPRSNSTRYLNSSFSQSFEANSLEADSFEEPVDDFISERELKVAAEPTTTRPNNSSAAGNRRARWRARNNQNNFVEPSPDHQDDFFQSHSGDINPAFSSSSPSASQRDLKHRPDSFRLEYP